MKKLLVVVLLVCAIGFVWYKRGVSAVGGTATKAITVESGMSVAQIAAKLEEADLIRSDRAFALYARLHGKQGSLKAGTYAIQASLSVPEIIELIESGKGNEISITIPEGFTIADIDALVASKGLGEPGDIIHCAFTCDFSSYEFVPKANVAAEEKGYASKLEGYVFPDTYFVSSVDYVPKFFLERTLNAFRSKVINGLSAEIKASGRPFDQIMTMASLIEEETITAAERPIVSGILWNRFNINMGLGVDATVRYALKKPTGALTKTDLDVYSDYNTRKYTGLPPGPIASPGLSSIKAALKPEETPYFYYLHDGDGQIHYARTNDEHNANKAQYLQ